MINSEQKIFELGIFSVGQFSIYQNFLSIWQKFTKMRMSTFSGFIIVFNDKSYKKIFEKLTKNEVDKFLGHSTNYHEINDWHYSILAERLEDDFKKLDNFI